MGNPHLSCRDLWGNLDSRMGDTEPPNTHPKGVGSQGWLSPKGTTPGMSHSPCYHLQAGASTPWGSALSLCNPQEAKQEHQPPSQGFPSEVFPSLGGKGPHEARPPWSHHPGGDSSTSCSPREEGRTGTREEEGHALREQHEKTNPLSVVPSCATLEMSLRVFSFVPSAPSRKARPPCQRGPLPSPHFISSKAKDSRVSPQHHQSRRLLPMVDVSRRELEPTRPALGVRQRGAIPSECCLPALPPLSKKNIAAFSSFQAAAPLCVCSG